MQRNPEIAQFADILRSRAQDGKMPVEGQVKIQPRYWIEVTKGGAGYFAVLLWDGMGFPEPWETGEGRYGEPEPACVEGRKWAAEEGVEFREPRP